MSQLRDLVKTAPASAVAVAEQGEMLFPQSPFAEERAALAIDALVNMGWLGDARVRAQEYFVCFPNGPHGADVTRRTGVKPLPKPPR